MRTLFLRLAGPMQSWGQLPRADYRDTGDTPTRSGVVGLLACALGVRSRAGLLEISATIERFGVRVDAPGDRQTDFQTIGGPLWSADGSGKPLDYRVATNRVYLVDASFLVAIQGPGDELERFAAALQRPRWPYFLGRRSCPPALPVFAGVADYDSIDAALGSHEWPEARESLLAYTESQNGKFQKQDRLAGRRVYTVNTYDAKVLTGGAK